VRAKKVGGKKGRRRDRRKEGERETKGKMEGGRGRRYSQEKIPGQHRD
jgi:hypothetical protein